MHGLFKLFNAESSPERYWRGWRSQEVGEEGDYTYNATVRLAVTTRVTAALIRAATRAILMFHWIREAHLKTVPIGHSFWREGRAEAGNRTAVLIIIIAIDCFDIALFSAIEQTHCALVAWNSEWVTVSFYSAFVFVLVLLISIKVAYLPRYLVVTWLVPRETAAVSVHVLCTPYNHAPSAYIPNAL